MVKISTRKLTLWELRFHLNRKNNNIESKRFWVRQTSVEKHSKVEFHVFVKEQKLLNHKFMILVAKERAFYYQFNFSKFLLVLESIFYCWIPIFSSICYVFWTFFSTKTEKKFSVQGKEIIALLAGALSQSWKFSISRKNFWWGFRP